MPATPIWSKRKGLVEPYPLIDHLLDTAASALVLWDEWLRPGLRGLLIDALGPEARSWVAAAAGLHDVGKCSPVFALRLGDERAPDWRATVEESLQERGYKTNVPVEKLDHLKNHALASALHLAETDLDDCAPGEDWLAFAALGHHGFFNGPKVVNERRPEVKSHERYAGGAWAETRDEIAQQVLIACGLPPDAKPPVIAGGGGVATTLISGLVILADRTASENASVAHGQANPWDMGLLADRVEFRRQWFAQRIRKTLGIYQGFDNPAEQILGRGPDGATWPMTELQQAAVSVGGGLWFAMAPTGNGKTEAALLRHTTREERLIFCLPTQATTNKMMGRIQEAFSSTPNSAELAHGMAGIEDFQAITSDGGLAPTEFVQRSSGSLFAAVSVATVDQVLGGALAAKWAHLRLLLTANAHVVIDEAHLMDHYQTRLATTLMTWWGATGTRVTVLTATLPTWQRSALGKAYETTWEPPTSIFPAHSVVPGIGAAALPAQEYSIDLELAGAEDPEKSHSEWVKAIHERYPLARIGVIANTINRAQAVAEAGAAAGIPVIILHSRMTAGHRRQQQTKLEDLLGRGGKGEGVLVVGTQAIEASLDIDLDFLSTDLAPAASLIQRAGRAWRHHTDEAQAGRARRIPGIANLPLRIVRSTKPYGNLPYFDAELGRTWNALEGRRAIVMPTESQALVEASAFSLDLADGEEPTRAELDEGASAATKLQRAGQAVHDIGQLLDPRRCFASTLAIMTGSNRDVDAATRMIEGDTAKVLLIDVGGKLGIPGAWTGTPAELESLHWRDQTGLRRAMEATIPLNGKLARAAERHTREGWAPVSRMLERITPVLVDGSSVQYSPVYGLIQI